jgi:hypothetical protein
VMAWERTETWLDNWTLLTWSSAMLCFAYNLFCVLLMAWKEWWQIKLIQFLFCHTHLLLHPNPVFLSIKSRTYESIWSWCHLTESWEQFSGVKYFYS